MESTVIIGNLISWAMAIGMMFVSMGILKRAKSLNKETGESIKVLRFEADDYDKKLESTGIVIKASGMKSDFEKMEDFDKLTFKFEWYIFGLQGIHFYVAAQYQNLEKDFDIFSKLEGIAIAWRKSPDDVFKDYLIVCKWYIQEKVPVTNSVGEVIGHASKATEKFGGIGGKNA